MTSTLRLDRITSVHRLLGGDEYDHLTTTFSARFSPDGLWVAASNSTGAVCIVNPRAVTNAASSTDTTAEGHAPTLEGTALVLQGSFDPCSSFSAPDVVTTSVRFRPSSGASPSALGAHLHPAFKTQGAETPDATTSVSYTVLCAMSGGGVQEWDVAPGHHYRLLSTQFEEGNSTMVADYSTEGGDLIASGGVDATLRVYTRDDSGQLQLDRAWDAGLNEHGGLAVGHHKRIMALVWASPTTFVSAGWEASPMLFDVRSHDHRPQRVFGGARVVAEGLDVRDGVLVTSSDRPSSNIQVFDVSSGKELRPAFAAADGCNLMACRAVGRPSRMHAWVVGRDPNAIFCYDLLSETVVAQASGFEGPLCTVDCHPADPGCVIAGGSGDTLYKIIADVRVA